MTDPSIPPKSNGNRPAPAPEREAPASPPRWVKVFGIVTAVLILLFIVLHLTGRGLGGHTL
jgi:hypothetical protein